MTMAAIPWPMVVGSFEHLVLIIGGGMQGTAEDREHDMKKQSYYVGTYLPVYV